MRNPATLKKISDHLSISISTVSRALKDHQDVSQETKRRVKELATMLDYEPNSFAINLRKKHSNLFAIIVPEISGHFYHSFIQAVEEQARVQGYSVMILQSQNDPEIEATNLKICRYNHVAGVFIAVSSSLENYGAFKKMVDWEIPIVFFDKVPSDGMFNKVCLADEQAGRLAAEKLVATNRNRILAIMANNTMSITRSREKGMRDYLLANGTGIMLDIVYSFNEEQTTDALENYFNKEQSTPAIFCMSDEILCTTIRFLNKRQIKFPEDVSLLAISNGFIPGLFNPMISYIETNGSELGKLSFNRMKEMMEGKKAIRENLLDCRFCEGGSM